MGNDREKLRGIRRTREILGRRKKTGNTRC